jgi:hypothetical protein
MRDEEETHIHTFAPFRVDVGKYAFLWLQRSRNLNRAFPQSDSLGAFNQIGLELA